MTTYVNTFRVIRFGFGGFFLAGIIILLATVIQLNLHSLATHTAEAEGVHQCFNRNGEIQRWENPETGKFFRICDNNGDWFGIQVFVKNADGTFREITSFIRKHHGKPVTNLSDVEKYIETAGKAKRILP